MGETAFIRGEGGSIFEMDWPLQSDVQKRFDKGHLQRVANLKGEPWVEPKPKRAKAAEPTSGSATEAELLAKIAELEAKLGEGKSTDDDLGIDGDTPPELRDFLSTPPEAPKPAPAPAKATAAKAQK